MNNGFNELLFIIGGAIIVAGAIFAPKKRSFWLFNGVAWVLLALAGNNLWFSILGFVAAGVSCYRWYREGLAGA